MLFFFMHILGYDLLEHQPYLLVGLLLHSCIYFNMTFFNRLYFVLGISQTSTHT